MIAPGDIVSFFGENTGEPMFWQQCVPVTINGDRQLQLKEIHKTQILKSDVGLVIGVWRISNVQYPVVYVYVESKRLFGYIWEFCVTKVSDVQPG